jgi:flavin-dependent dehydrogenase
MNRTRHVQRRASGFTLPKHIHARFAGGAITSPAAGRGWIAVGDAAAAFDPLSSAGLTHALDSAIDAAERIRHTLSGATTALDDYVACTLDEYDAYLAARQQYYARERRWHDQPFWRARSG